MIRVERFHNATGIWLENSRARVVLLPDHGGKLVSFYHKARAFELLFQNPNKTFRRASLYDDFAQFEACGFDDAFPSVDQGLVRVGEKNIRYPDHGEIWTAEMAYRIQDEDLIFNFHSKILPYRYEKSVKLIGNTLTYQYSIFNDGSVSFPYLWIFHGLVPLYKGMELFYPEGLEKTIVFTGLNMEKWYLNGKVNQGRCGYRFPEHKMAATICYDPLQLPYLGYWITRGGFRGDENCALEPANGFYDSIGTAEKNKACPVLFPGENVVFWLSIALDEV